MDILANLNHRLTVANAGWAPCYGREEAIEEVISRSPVPLPEDYISFLRSISGGTDFELSLFVDDTKFQIEIWSAEAALEEFESELEILPEEDYFRHQVWSIGRDKKDLVYFYAEGKEGFGLYSVEGGSTCIDDARKVADTLTNFLVNGIGIYVPVAYRTDVAMRVYDIAYYGKATYDIDLEFWKRTTPIEIPFNGKICSLDFYIEDASPMYTQIQYGLDDFGITLDQIQDWQLEHYQKAAAEQKELFDKYLKNPSDVMKRFEEEIIEDFYEVRENFLEDEEWSVREFGEEITEKIRTADTREKILDLVHLKELTLATNQIRITGACDYCDIDYGVGITLDGTIDVGSVEMIYR